MAKTIEARAVISAADKTGSVFDQIAAKLKGVEKTAKSLGEIKGPKFTGDMWKELERLKLTEKELKGVRKSFGAMEQMLKSQPIAAKHYFRAMDDWKGKTVDHWREVKAAVDDTEKAQKRFFKTAGHFAVHAALGGGALYAGAHAVREQVKSLGERNRAQVRYEQMGLSEAQLGEATVMADAISARYPSISRTEVLNDIRTNASRLGSFDRAKEIADIYARARVANKISGGDDHELEQVVRALEGSGKANSAAEFSQGLNMWSKAKAANPDYTGEQFRSDLSAASSAKYGMSKDYLDNVFPILASHTSGFGNKLSTGLSALVGNRMTAATRKELAKVGLRDKNGGLVDEAGYIANNYAWTQKYIKPLLEKQGIHFGEEMSEGDKGKVVDWLQHHFSARNAADLMATNLLDEPLVERARQRKTMGLEGVPALQAKDASLAFEALSKQALDAGNSLMGLSGVVKGLNIGSGMFANLAHFFRTGEMPMTSPAMRAGNAIEGWWKGLGGNYGDWAETQRRGNLLSQSAELDAKINGWGLDENTKARLRLRKFDVDEGIYASQMFADQNKPLSGSFQPGASGAMPAVQSLEGATVQANVTGNVEGEAKITVEVTASSLLETLVKQAQEAVKLVGSLSSNGPGSTGKSSPDAEPGIRPSTGLASPLP